MVVFLLICGITGIENGNYKKMILVLPAMDKSVRKRYINELMIKYSKVCDPARGMDDFKSYVENLRYLEIISIDELFEKNVNNKYIIFDDVDLMPANRVLNFLLRVAPTTKLVMLGELCHTKGCDYDCENALIRIDNFLRYEACSIIYRFNSEKLMLSEVSNVIKRKLENSLI